MVAHDAKPMDGLAPSRVCLGLNFGLRALPALSRFVSTGVDLLRVRVHCPVVHQYDTLCSVSLHESYMHKREIVSDSPKDAEAYENAHSYGT